MTSGDFVRIFATWIVSMIGLGSAAYATTYNLPLEGRLTEANGKPIAGPVALSVSFYRVAEGGSPILTLTEGLGSVALQEGVFQLRLSLAPSDYQAVFPSVVDRVFAEVTDLTHAAGKPYARFEIGMMPYAGKIPVDDKTISFDSQGRATLTAAGAATTGRLLSADGSGGLAWIDAPSAAVTAVGGVAAASVATGATAANAAASISTASTIVKRDASGGFVTDNVLINPGVSTRRGLVVKGAASQSVALQEWQNSAGDVLAAIDPTGALKFKDGDGTTNYVSLKAPTAVGSDVNYTLPGSIVAGRYLTTDVNGVMSWADIGSTTPSTGAFTTLTTTGAVGIGTASPSAPLDVKGNMILGAAGVAQANTVLKIGPNSMNPYDITLASGTGYGIANTVSANVTGNAALLTAGYSAAQMSVGAGVTLSNYYGNYIDAPSKVGAGTVTNAYGLYVNAPTIGSKNVSAYFEGSVGIGTTSPTGKLHVSAAPVASATEATVGITNGGIFAGGHASGQYFGINAASGNSANLMTLATNGAAAVEVRASGSLVVGPGSAGGTASTMLVDVSDGAVYLVHATTPAAPIRRVAIDPLGLYNNSGTMTMLGIDLPDETSGTGGVAGLVINKTGTGTGTGQKTLLDLQVSGSSKFIVDAATGNVGVGTSTPKTTLDINGVMRLAVNGTVPFACAPDKNGAFALTSAFTTCVCKGSSSTWVRTTDGTTGCTW